MSELTLSPQVFSILSGLVEERVGLAYGPADRSIFESKASTRALEAGFESMLDYYYYLRYDDPDQREFRALVEALLVHETYFFRELASLRVAIDTFVRPVVEAHGRARIWCAACSTGEEPTTMAMLLHERGLLGRVELLASDVSDDALARARSGRFGRRALRESSPSALAARYIERRGTELWVAPALTAAIDFRNVNLVDPEQVSALGHFDLIVCRNVLIYLRDERAREVVGRLSRQLPAGGVLLVGVSESLLRFGSELHCEEHGGVFFYRKPGRP